MSGEKIIRALDGIPDAQLQSAMGVYERKKKLKYIWVRVVAALIVLAVVLFLLLGCSSPVNDIVDTPGENSASTYAENWDLTHSPVSF